MSKSVLPAATGLTLYRNGSVYSAADPYATAMLVDGGTVAWIGSEHAATSIADSTMRIVDLDGRLVAPGFVDSHAHVTQTGLALSSLDLTGCASLAELLDAVAAAARQNSAPVLGHGWDETRWPENRAPSAAELDRAAAGAEIFLTRVDVHSAVVSAALAARLRLSELPGWTEDGTVRGPALERARHAVQTPAAGQRAELQRRALQHAASRGYVALTEMAAPQLGPAEDLLELLALSDAEPGPRILPYWGELMTSAEQVTETMERFSGRLRGLAGDLTMDGSIGSHSAAVSAGYADRPGEHGSLYVETEAAARHFEVTAVQGIQAGFHVIGDAALLRVLDAMDLAAERIGQAAVRSARPRLEHVEMLPDGALERLLQHGVTASMQPLFDAYWGGPKGMYASRLGEKAALAMNAVGTLQTAGVPVAIGSDAPVTEQSPWATVKACLEHHNRGEQMSARAAFLAHTRAGWRAAGERNPMEGQLAPGTPATFAVWDAEELSIQTPDSRVSAWSTDARAGTPMLPSLDNGRLPSCVRTVVNGITIHDVL
ncbi:amidohydrolase family protein [Arthrobacter sp. NPDC089319]|uniref:amidohydrolase n=1 Tax=Arthrobacter sp. NPDC089319 TaxID=3155915 RepID=UPI0034240E4F